MNEQQTTSFQQVAQMNEAFGNPKGNYKNLDVLDLFAQCRNIFDEYVELLTAFGLDESGKQSLRAWHDVAIARIKQAGVNIQRLPARDALCDIQVFAMGAQHKMGVDGDADMRAVVEGVMTRFVKDEADLEATLAMHKAKGVESFRIEGSYPTVVVRSDGDFPDAPKGKFLKSASYRDTVFPDVL